MAKLEEINQIIKKMARARDKDGGRNVRRILLGGVNAPLPPEAKKIWLRNGAFWSTGIYLNKYVVSMSPLSTHMPALIALKI